MRQNLAFLVDLINGNYALMPGMGKVRSSSDQKKVKHFGQSFPTGGCSLRGRNQSSASTNDIHLESVQPLPNGQTSEGSKQTNCDVEKPLDCSACGDSGIEIQEAIESSIIAEISDLEVHLEDVPSEKLDTVELERLGSPKK